MTTPARRWKRWVLSPSRPITTASPGAEALQANLLDPVLFVDGPAHLDDLVEVDGPAPGGRVEAAQEGRAIDRRRCPSEVDLDLACAQHQDLGRLSALRDPTKLAHVFDAVQVDGGREGVGDAVTFEAPGLAAEIEAIEVAAAVEPGTSWPRTAPPK
jgi:hypothetical protein